MHFRFYCSLVSFFFECLFCILLSWRVCYPNLALFVLIDLVDLFFLDIFEFFFNFFLVFCIPSGAKLSFTSVFHFCFIAESGTINNYQNEDSDKSY